MTMNNMKEIFRSAPLVLSEAKQGAPYPEEIQLLKEGDFTDSKNGKFKITRQMFSEITTNFKANIRGVKPAVDINHESEGPAAAWIKDVLVREVDGKQSLWGVPSWTGLGERTLDDRTYGYISAEVDPRYKDNEKGNFHGAVLLGAALTNRPVIKNMNSVIQLSEGVSMNLTPEQLAKLDALMKELGVSSIEEMISAIAKMREAKPADEGMKEKEKEVEAAKLELSETSKNVIKLSEEVKTLKTENEKMKNEKVFSEKEKAFNLLLSEGKAIPAQKEAYISGDILKFSELAPKGGVKITETGTEAGNDGSKEAKDKADAESKILVLAEKKVKEKEAKNIGEAVSLVLIECPDLAKAYNG